MEIFIKTTTGLRRFLYLVTPNETSFQELHEVPKYVDEAIPFFVGLIALELVVLYLQGKNLPRLNDSISSISAGVLSLLHSLLFRSVELAAYVWVYERFNLVSLPWDNAWTWILGFLGVDFCYYWVHRCGHEVNIVWAGHQAHHSSEEYNLTTALRQSAILRYMTWVFYLPMALCVPPSIFLVHNQFNLLYQFWIHTETIESLGPLEWILNTPSHHRVHHGRNPYCIDKNYGGTLIIFDRIFGTFQAEREEVIYGLVHSLDSWNPIHAQLCHLQYMMSRFKEEKGFVNKMSLIFKGPGWSEGKPWTGLLSDIPEGLGHLRTRKAKEGKTRQENHRDDIGCGQIESPVQKYDRTVPHIVSAYVLCHFVLVILGYIILSAHKTELSTIWMSLCIVYIIVSLTSFGAMYDQKDYSPLLELFRCAIFVIVFRFYPVSMTVDYIISIVYMVSLTLCVFVCLKRYVFTSKLLLKPKAA